MPGLLIFTLHPQSFVLEICGISQKQHSYGQQHKLDMRLAKQVDIDRKCVIVQEVGPQECDEKYERQCKT